MSWDPVERDFELTHGAVWRASWICYADPRVLNKRGLWDRHRSYEIGDGVTHPDGSAFVALIPTDGVNPGEGFIAPFWSPVTPRDLTGCVVDFVCGSVFELEPPLERELGKVDVTVHPELFATAPDSEHYYVRVTEESGDTSYVGRGTLLFKKP